MISRLHVFHPAWCNLLIALSFGACGRISFDPIPVSEDGDVVDATSAIDANTVVLDAPPALATTASLRLLGTASCTGPDNAVVVPSGGITAGATVIVQIVRRVDSGTISVADSGGNAYTEVAVSSNSGIKTLLLQSTITTALATGETIDIAESNPAASAIIIFELTGANPDAFSSQAAGADDANISIAFTSTSPGVVLCAGGTRDGDVVMSDNWDELAVVKDDCGGNSELTAFGFSISAGQDGLSSCDAALQLEAGFLKWTGLVQSYGE